MYPLNYSKYSAFQSFSMEHLLALAFFAALTFLVIYLGKYRLLEKGKQNLGLFLATIPVITMGTRMFYVWELGLFDIKEDLPLYFCRVMAMILPFVLLTKNRFWLGILYFWILAGTTNAVITPDLVYGFPHFEYWIYWIYHSMLIVTILYAVVVFEVEIGWRDYRNAVIGTILFSGLTLLINLVLESNYNYLSHKPEGGSILDFMGPWPWYIGSVFLLMFFLFFILLIPFLIRKRKKLLISIE